MGTFTDLVVYKKAYQQAMKIFQISKNFPIEERYSLIDQIRRSSRSVCVNIGEGYRKRQYVKHFLSKLSDADMENSETLIWLQFAFSCQYIDRLEYIDLKLKTEEVGKIIGYMIKNPNKYISSK